MHELIDIVKDANRKSGDQIFRENLELLEVVK